MPRAIWNGAVIVESEDTVKVEENHYFPRESVNSDYLVERDTHTVCPWKRAAGYYTLEVDGQRNLDDVLVPPAAEERGRPGTQPIAFWHGVKIEPTEADQAAGGRRGLIARSLTAWTSR